MPAGARRERLVVRTPGKLILMGEHAVVYGEPAVVGALDLLVEAELSLLARSPKIELEIDGRLSSLDWEEVECYRRTAEREWIAWSRDAAGRFEPYALPGGGIDRHNRLITLALAEAATATVPADAGRRPGVHLRLESQLPIGAGCGSSAAVGACVVAAWHALFRSELNLDQICRTSLVVERYQHGSPSGADTAAVIKGGLSRIQQQEGGLEVLSLGDPAALLGRFEVYDSGRPAEETGSVVAKVRALAHEDPARFSSAVSAISRATARFVQALEEGNEEQLIDSVRGAQAGLEAFGVVPNAVSRVVRQVESKGGAAKISGAGSTRGESAGILLVYHPVGERLAATIPSPYRRLHCAIGGPGLTCDVIPEGARKREDDDQ